MVELLKVVGFQEQVMLYINMCEVAAALRDNIITLVIDVYSKTLYS